MNSTHARESKRHIRRAFGPEAVELLQRQTEATNFCTATVSAVSERIEGFGVRVSQLETRLEKQAEYVSYLGDRVLSLERQAAVLADASEPLRRSFFGRLRWLLTGK